MRKRPQYGMRKKKQNNRFEWENKEGWKEETKSFLIISQKAEALGMCKKGFFHLLLAVFLFPL